MNEGIRSRIENNEYTICNHFSAALKINIPGPLYLINVRDYQAAESLSGTKQNLRAFECF